MVLLKMKNRVPLHCVKDSLSGVREGWRRDFAIRRQLGITLLAVILLLMARAPAAWLLASIVLLMLGLAVELMNAALEALLDRLHPEWDETIGAAKDMASAAAFLVNAAAVVTIGVALIVSLSG